LIPVAHRLHEQPIVARGATHMAHAPRQQRLDPLPLVVPPCFPNRWLPMRTAR
jgi:hypothetical protein